MIEVVNHTIDNVAINTNGGYIGYWGLYGDLISQMKEMKKLVGTLQEMTIDGIPQMKKFSKKAWFKMNVQFVIKTPWWLLIKPLGGIFNTRIRYVGTYKSKSYDEEQEINSVNIKKTSTLYFARVFPIFFLKGRKLNKTDLKSIFGDKVENVNLRRY